MNHLFGVCYVCQSINPFANLLGAWSEWIATTQQPGPAHMQSMRCRASSSLNRMIRPSVPACTAHIIPGSAGQEDGLLAPFQAMPGCCPSRSPPTASGIDRALPFCNQRGVVGLDWHLDGDAEGALDGARRLRQDGQVRGPPSAADGPTAAMEEGQLHPGAAPPPPPASPARQQEKSACSLDMY